MTADYEEYKVHIEQFEGPLDLLLFLIGRARIDIEQIFVSEVTGQFLSYVSEMQSLPMESASEFLEMAATLLYIKSRMMLPREDEEEAEEEDAEMELIERLKAYKTFKDASEQMRPLEDKGLCSYYKLPEEIAFPDEKWEFEEMTLQGLAEAFMEVLMRIPDAQPERMEVIEIQRDTVSFKDKRHHILNMLSKIKTLNFFSLFSESRTRLEVAVTFLALLDLIHKNIVTIQQSACFEDITITKISEEAAG
jgi:segregation and condensation protein A